MKAPVMTQQPACTRLQSIEFQALQANGSTLAEHLLCLEVTIEYGYAKERGAVLPSPPASRSFGCSTVRRITLTLLLELHWHASFLTQLHLLFSQRVPVQWTFVRHKNPVPAQYLASIERIEVVPHTTHPTVVLTLLALPPERLPHVHP